ncbi:ALG6, ALG8 glycosyltransferase [Clavulina sp. PMI_390]|nr:ALG6, ALG8 glycosyltransferase [Clavulina sp. PMI_390]
MYGDFEAQRHWMELSIHLPPSAWYFYDLKYWGLDYPPLTAYISWACGYIGHTVNPLWFALESSRGFESSSMKTFMRLSALFTDAAFYFTAILFYCRSYLTSRSNRSQTLAAITLLLHPSLILIDHGHFQYNSVMLGLSISSVCLFHIGYDVPAAVAFVLSLGFKQMALYYSPAIFGFCLGKCFFLGLHRGGRLFIRLGVTVIGTFGVLLLPFGAYQFSSSNLRQIVIRMFPFGRGLFEDKVANFWGASNVVFKWRESSLRDNLPIVALIATIAAILPSFCHILYLSYTLIKEPYTEPSDGAEEKSLLQPSPTVPTSSLLPLALFNSSMAFFLFSFQVHEKSILLPLVPFTLVMSAREDLGPMGVGVWEWGMLLNNAAAFSLWPLLKKDAQGLQYVALVLGWNYIVGYHPLKIPTSFVKAVTMIAYLAFTVLHSAEALLNAPQRYPDLFVVLNTLLCSGVFVLCWLYGMKRQLEVGFALSSR